MEARSIEVDRRRPQRPRVGPARKGDHKRGTGVWLYEMAKEMRWLIRILHNWWLASNVGDPSFQLSFVWVIAVTLSTLCQWISFAVRKPAIFQSKSLYLYILFGLWSIHFALGYHDFSIFMTFRGASNFHWSAAQIEEFWTTVLPAVLQMFLISTLGMIFLTLLVITSPPRTQNDDYHRKNSTTS